MLFRSENTSANDSSPVAQLTIQNIPGSAIPGCEPDCFSPSNGVVNPGGIVTWENTDSAAHTVTSGSPENGPDGVFDSGIIMSNELFSYKFETSGTFDYFCMVHPWMTGTIIVTGSEVVIEDQVQEDQVVEATQQDNFNPIIADVINISSSAESPECHAEKKCITPYNAQVVINQNVTWSATPFATSIVSGNVTSGPDGLFDFGFKINEESVYAYNQTGVFQYFDLMRPWIAGTVTVTAENLLMHLYNSLQTQLLLPSAFAVTEFPISTDSDAYTHGQIVKVSGITSDKNISLQVKDPSGKTVLIRTLSADKNFSYEMN